MTKQLILYSGPHCSLCEKAKQLIWPAIEQSNCRLTEVDITTDVELLRRYRLRIPVLADPEGRELSWPFDAETLQSWLNA